MSRPEVVWGPGERVGPYRLERCAGAGGEAEVWAAVDTRTGRAVALKRWLRDAAPPPPVHPRLLPVEPWTAPDGAAVGVMPWLGGGTLSARLGPQGQPAAAVQAWVPGVLAGLAALHAAGRCHGDVKPENILFTDISGESPLLADALDPAELHDHPGTPRYQAPELRRGALPHPAADVFALGLVVWEALTGAVPPRGAAGAEPGPPVDPRVPAAWRGLLFATLHPEPAARPTAAELGAWWCGPEDGAALAPVPGPLFGRTAALAAATAALARGAPVVVHGPRWVGKSALVHVLLDRDRARGARWRDRGEAPAGPGLSGYDDVDTVDLLALAQRARGPWVATTSGPVPRLPPAAGAAPPTPAPVVVSLAPLPVGPAGRGPLARLAARTGAAAPAVAASSGLPGALVEPPDGAREVLAAAVGGAGERVRFAALGVFSAPVGAGEVAALWADLGLRPGAVRGRLQRWAARGLLVPGPAGQWTALAPLCAVVGPPPDAAWRHQARRLSRGVDPGLVWALRADPEWRAWLRARLPELEGVAASPAAAGAAGLRCRLALAELWLWESSPRPAAAALAAAAPGATTDPALWAALWSAVARLALRQSDLPAAEEALAAGRARVSGAGPVVHQLQWVAGLVDLRASRTEAAETGLAAAAAALDRRGPAAGAGCVRIAWSAALINLQRFDQAAAVLEQAAADFAVAADTDGLAKVSGNLGVIALRRSDNAAAVVHLERAQALLRDHGEPDALAVALANLAAAEVEQGARSAAIAHLTEALAAFQQAGNRRSVALARAELGNLHLRFGDLRKAVGYSTRALRGLARVEAWRLRARTGVDLAVARLEQGRPERAQAAAAEAQADAERAGAADLVDFAVVVGAAAGLWRGEAPPELPAAPAITRAAQWARWVGATARGERLPPEDGLLERILDKNGPPGA